MSHGAQMAPPLYTPLTRIKLIVNIYLWSHGECGYETFWTTKGPYYYGTYNGTLRDEFLDLHLCSNLFAV